MSWLRTNHERIASRIAAIAEFNDAPELGGTTRLAYTPTCRQALDLVAQWMEDCSMTTWMDAAGNLIGRIEGAGAGGRSLAIGSHIDTVENGGNYDGVIGVLAGLEVAAYVAENGLSLDRPLEVIVFCEEEGARFGGGLFGSRALTGAIGKEALQLTDRDGVSREDALRAFGGYPSGLPAGDAVRQGGFSAYLEMHIEQGPALAGAGVPIGVVEGIVGLLSAEVLFRGETNHAGATPMKARHDALLGLCELALEVERLCNLPDYAARGTVGTVDVRAGGVNAVPGLVAATIDLRDLDPSVIASTWDAVRVAGGAIARRRGLSADFSVRLQAAPALCDEWIAGLIEKNRLAMNVPTMRMASGAGHDAQTMARVCPMGMIFVRSSGGSHNPNEFAAPEDIALGADILLRTALDIVSATIPVCPE